MSITLQDVCDAFADRTLAEEEEAVFYLNSKLRDDTILNFKALLEYISRDLDRILPATMWNAS